MFINEKTYQLDRSVLYNNCNTNNLYQAVINPDRLSFAGGVKKILAGSFLIPGERLLPRALVMSAYTAGGSNIVVNNPWVFLPGDNLYIINDTDEEALGESNTSAMTSLGTVASVNSNADPYSVNLTFSALAEGDTVKVTLNEITATIETTSTDLNSEVARLKQEFSNSLSPGFNSLDGVKITVSSRTLTITAKDAGSMFVVKSEVTGAGSVEVEALSGFGSIEITADGAGANLPIGAKIGAIDTPVLGVIAHTRYLTNFDSNLLAKDVAAYDTANINKKSLPYLDGNIVAQLPTLKFIPPYGR